MNGKKKIIIGIILVVILAISSIAYYINYNPYKGTPLEPIYGLVKIQYFDKDSYEEYKKLFTNPNGTMMTKGQFDAYRQNNKPEDMFKYDSKKPKAVMEHMKAVQEEKNSNQYRVYYLKDINNESEMKGISYWLVEKKNGVWFLKND